MHLVIPNIGHVNQNIQHTYTYLQKYTTYVRIYQNIHHKRRPRHWQRIADAPVVGNWVASKAITGNPVTGCAYVGVSPPGFLKIFKC
jgi:hypothetical protein